MYCGIITVPHHSVQSPALTSLEAIEESEEKKLTQFYLQDGKFIPFSIYHNYNIIIYLDMQREGYPALDSSTLCTPHHSSVTFASNERPTIRSPISTMPVVTEEPDIKKSFSSSTRGSIYPLRKESHRSSISRRIATPSILDNIDARFNLEEEEVTLNLDRPSNIDGRTEISNLSK